MKGSTRSLPLLLCLLLLVVACTTPETPSPEAPITVEDALGRTITFEAPPQRIVIAGRANFMLEDAVYMFPTASERVVGLTQARQRTTPFISLLDDDHADKVRFTSESTAEEIATAQPDLVLLKRMMQEPLGNALEVLDIPVVYLDLETPEQYERDLATLGDIFGDPARAQAAWDFYATRLAALAEEVAELSDEDKPEVLVVQYNTRGEEVAVEVPPLTWIQTEMVVRAGGEPAWTEAAQGGGWTVVNLEQIAAWNPDQIYVISYFENVDEAVARLAADPNWQALEAVQQDRIFGFPKDFYSWDQADARWILGMMWMASQMHPERFAEIDMGDEIVAFYSELYNLERDAIESNVVPLLEGDVTVP